MKIKNNILPLLLLSIIILGIIYLYWHYIASIILAGTLAVVLHPLYRQICTRMSDKRAANVVIILAVILITIIATFIISVFIHSSGYITEMTDTIVEWLNSLPDFGIIQGSLFGHSVGLTSNFVKNMLIQIASNLPQFFIFTLFFLLSLFLFLMHGKELVEDFFSAIPEHLQAVSSQLQKDVVNTLYATYIVNLQICVITFIIAIPFYWLLGLNGGIIENATLTAISQLIPTIGPLLVLAFIGLYALALGDINTAIFSIIIGYFLFMFLPGSILKPKMMGKRISLPAPMMMIAIIGAIATIGLTGIILGPLFATLLVSGYRLLIVQMKAMKGEIPE